MSKGELRPPNDLIGDLATATVQAMRFMERCELLAAEMKRHTENFEMRRRIMMGAVQAAADFLREFAPGSDGAAPLLALRMELQSIEDGRGSRPLSSPQTISGPASPEAMENLALHAVAAVNALATGAGMKVDDACARVADRIRLARGSSRTDDVWPSSTQLKTLRKNLQRKTADPGE